MVNFTIACVVGSCDCGAGGKMRHGGQPCAMFAVLYEKTLGSHKLQRRSGCYRAIAWIVCYSHYVDHSRPVLRGDKET